MLVPALGSAADRTTAQNGQRVRIVVGFARGATSAQRSQIVKRDNGRLLRDIVALRATEATVDPAVVDAVLARLRSESIVDFAEVDQKVSLEHPIIGKLIH